jgi:hypothetical protein
VRQTKLGTSPTMTGSSARGRAAPGYGKTSLLIENTSINKGTSCKTHRTVLNILATGY